MVVPALGEAEVVQVEVQVEGVAQQEEARVAGSEEVEAVAQQEEARAEVQAAAPVEVQQEGLAQLVEQSGESVAQSRYMPIVR